MQLAAFEMIPTDEIYDDMINELDKQEVKFDEELQDKFASQGFETVWLLPNLGSVTFFMCLFPIMIGILVIIFLLSLCNDRW